MQAVPGAHVQGGALEPAIAAEEGHADVRPGLQGHAGAVLTDAAEHVGGDGVGGRGQRNRAGIGVVGVGKRTVLCVGHGCGEHEDARQWRDGAESNRHA